MSIAGFQVKDPEPTRRKRKSAYGRLDVGCGFAAVGSLPPNSLAIMLELFNYLAELIEKMPYEQEVREKKKCVRESDMCGVSLG
jgi:hypothetical protein